MYHGVSACWKPNEFRDDICRKEIQGFFSLQRQPGRCTKGKRSLRGLSTRLAACPDALGSATQWPPNGHPGSLIPKRRARSAQKPACRGHGVHSPSLLSAQPVGRRGRGLAGTPAEARSCEGLGLAALCPARPLCPCWSSPGGQPSVASTVKPQLHRREGRRLTPHPNVLRSLGYGT